MDDGDSDCYGWAQYASQNFERADVSQAYYDESQTELLSRDDVVPEKDFPESDVIPERLIRNDDRIHERLIPNANPLRGSLIPNANPLDRRLIPNANPSYERLIPNDNPSDERLIPNANPPNERLIPNANPSDERLIRNANALSGSLPHIGGKPDDVNKLDMRCVILRLSARGFLHIDGGYLGGWVFFKY